MLTSELRKVVSKLQERIRIARDVRMGVVLSHDLCEAIVVVLKEEVAAREAKIEEHITGGRIHGP